MWKSNQASDITPNSTYPEVFVDILLLLRQFHLDLCQCEEFHRAVAWSTALLCLFVAVHMQAPASNTAVMPSFSLFRSIFKNTKNNWNNTIPLTCVLSYLTRTFTTARWSIQTYQKPADSLLSNRVTWIPPKYSDFTGNISWNHTGVLPNRHLTSSESLLASLIYYM